MIDNIRSLQQDIRNILASLKKISSKQIGNKSLMSECKNAVDFYFRNIRNNINDTNTLSSTNSLDDAFQNLLMLTHKRSLKTIYNKTLTDIKNLLITLETEAISDIHKSKSSDTIEKVDREIILTLKNLINSSSLAYEQALIDLQSNSRLSWRGPATDLRESLRECLDYLAPDADVTAQPGFKLEQNTTAPTMKQKIKYIMKSRGKGSTEIKTTENAINIIDELLGTFVRSVYTRASVSTHTPTDKNEVLRILNLVRVVFCEILEVN